MRTDAFIFRAVPYPDFSFVTGVGEKRKTRFAFLTFHTPRAFHIKKSGLSEGLAGPSLRRIFLALEGKASMSLTSVGLIPRRCVPKRHDRC